MTEEYSQLHVEEELIEVSTNEELNLNLRMAANSSGCRNRYLYSTRDYGQ